MMKPLLSLAAVGLIGFAAVKLVGLLFLPFVGMLLGLLAWALKIAIIIACVYFGFWLFNKIFRSEKSAEA